MKKSRKIFIVFIVVFVGIAIGIYIFVRMLAGSGLADYNQDMQLKGLSGEVEVLRDSFGVAHVFAENQTDLYRVVGYIQARDRFWQMDLLRRITTGRLSEMFGEDMIDADILFRSLRISEKSKAILENCNPELKEILDAYVAGVNQYLEEDDLSFEFTVLGYEPEKWEAYHSINLIGYMAWSLNTGWRTETAFHKLKQKITAAHFDELIAALDYPRPVYPDFDLKGIPDDSAFTAASEKTAALMPAVFSGSNNWAVAGSKSTTGKPILANDMHLGLMSPGVWTQMRHYVKGELDVTGVVLPGQPFIIVGHNADIAWGMTNVMLDDIDFYVETVNPADSNQYKLDGAWKDYNLVNEKIAVKGSDTVEHLQRYSHRGPVISGMKNIENEVVSMHWLGNDESNELRTVYLLNRAKNWDDFKNAVKTFISVAQNVNYADTKGNIGLYCCAGIPKRELPGWMFFPGDTTLYDWKAFVPFDSLPHQYNPERGYVISSNNRTVSDKYPYYISAWYDLPNRFNRIEQLLTEKEKLSPEDFKNIQTDQHSLFAEGMLPKILMQIDENALSENEKISLDILKAWDYEMGADKTAPLIFEEFYLVFAKNLLHDEMGDDLYREYQKYGRLTNYMTEYILKNPQSVWVDKIDTDETENLTDIVRLSFEQTTDSLTAKYGKNIKHMKWGDAHKVNIEHPLGKVAILDLLFGLNHKTGVGGSYHNVNPYSYSFAKPFESSTGASQRHIYSLGNFDESYVAIPTGVSGIPGSKHYLDQADDFIQGIYHPDYFSPEIVKENAAYKMKFLP